jgi:hypothetical protein
MTIYYKTVRREHFKPGLILDTSTYNYGLVPGDLSQQEEAVFQAILQHSESVGFENLIVLALNASRGFGDEHVPHVRARIGDAKTDRFVKLARAASALSTVPSNVAAIRFWEYLYESVRKTHAPKRPIRTRSIFVCLNQEAIDKYRQRHGLGELLCRVELIEGTSFIADMTLLDRISPNASYTDSAPDVKAYWDGKISSDPLREVLLQGRVRLLPVEG